MVLVDDPWHATYSMCSALTIPICTIHFSPDKETAQFDDHLALNYDMTTDVNARIIVRLQLSHVIGYMLDDRMALMRVCWLA